MNFAVAGAHVEIDPIGAQPEGERRGVVQQSEGGRCLVENVVDQHGTQFIGEQVCAPAIGRHNQLFSGEIALPETNRGSHAVRDGDKAARIGASRTAQDRAAGDCRGDNVGIGRCQDEHFVTARRRSCGI